MQDNNDVAIKFIREAIKEVKHDMKKGLLAEGKTETPAVDESKLLKEHVTKELLTILKQAGE
jgi:Mg-chelatase subunit ChlI